MQGVMHFVKLSTSALIVSALIGVEPAIADQVIADNLIVQGKACIGPPCINGETFQSIGSSPRTSRR